MLNLVVIRVETNELHHLSVFALTVELLEKNGLVPSEPGEDKIPVSRLAVRAEYHSVGGNEWGAANQKARIGRGFVT